MVNDRLHSYASKRMTKWSKRQLPGYWPALQVLCLAGFGVFVVVGLVGGGDAPPPTAGPGALPSATGTVSASPAPEPSDPTATAEPSATPTTAAPTPSGPTVEVLNISGVPVAVPQDAVRVATDGLRALFDPAVASTVPVAGGGTVSPPSRLFPDATVGTLVVVSADATHLVFATTTDADGAAPDFTPTDSTVSVVLDGGAWAVDLS